MKYFSTFSGIGGFTRIGGRDRMCIYGKQIHKNTTTRQS